MHGTDIAAERHVVTIWNPSILSRYLGNFESRHLGSRTASYNYNLNSVENSDRAMDRKSRISLSGLPVIIEAFFSITRDSDIFFIVWKTYLVQKALHPLILQ
jgi:hypothetical protein